jgi:4-amino-4-deoxy-L-arabinose transferase-like glycosyltransferase
LACGCKYTGFIFVGLPLCAAILFLPHERHRTRVARLLIFVLTSGLLVSPWLIKNVIATGNPVFPLANQVFGGEPPGFTAEETLRWDSAHRPQHGDTGVAAMFLTLAQHTVLDQYQRFNVLVLLLGVAGLLRRRRERMDAVLLAILGVQVAAWLMVTHLYARFLTPAIIPVILLAGRSVSVEASAIRRGVIWILVIVSAAWNTAFTSRLFAREWPGAIPAAFIYEGKIGAYEHFGWINSLDAGARVLLIGEARAFYLPSSTAYWTTFNRNPFLEQVARHSSNPRAPGDHTPFPPERAGDLLRWLQEGRYTHLLVNWTEIRRLVRSYGFSPRASEEQIYQAVAELEKLGLKQLEPRQGGDGSASVLYEIPSR